MRSRAEKDPEARSRPLESLPFVFIRNRERVLKIDPRFEACLPKRLHPVSRRILEAWLAGLIPTPVFQRFFHLPNSDYLPVGECLIAASHRIRRSRRA